MNRLNLKKLAAAGMLTAIAVVLSSISIPVGASRCYPVQHLINVMAGVFLGPLYGVSMAFCTSLIRNLMGTGSLLAFPGSMVGALLCGLLYQRTHKMWAAFLGETVGTGILGGLLCYPVATLLLGKEAALFAYVLPFLISSVGGALLSVAFLTALDRTKALDQVKHSLGV